MVKRRSIKTNIHGRFDAILDDEGLGEALNAAGVWGGVTFRDDTIREAFEAEGYTINDAGLEPFKRQYSPIIHQLLTEAANGIFRTVARTEILSVEAGKALEELAEAEAELESETENETQEEADSE